MTVESRPMYEVDQHTLFQAVENARTSYEAVISIPKLGHRGIEIAERWFNAVLRVGPSPDLFQRATEFVMESRRYRRWDVNQVAENLEKALYRNLYMPGLEFAFATTAGFLMCESDMIELVEQSPDAADVINAWLVCLMDAGYITNSFLRADRLYVKRNLIAIDENMDPHGYISKAKAAVLRVLTEKGVPCTGKHWKS